MNASKKTISEHWDAGGIIKADKRMTPTPRTDAFMDDLLNHPNRTLATVEISAGHAMRTLERENAALVEALEYVASLYGNLPIEDLDSKCGPHESKHRGLMLKFAIEMPRAALALAKGGV